MRRAVSVVLALLLAAPPAGLQSAPALGVIQGLVTLGGRPVAGVGLALVDVESGAVSRVTSATSGAFEARVPVGRYVVTTEGRSGLIVGRAPSLVPVLAGRVASARIDLLALSSATGQEPQAPGTEGATITLQPEATCFLAGEFPLIEAAIEPAPNVARARVYFKSALGTSYYYVEMTAGEGKFSGKLP